MKEEQKASFGDESYWTLEHIVSIGFNRLKAKLYNLIEASTADKTQQEALKGLTKGFANDEYRNTIVDMQDTAKRLKFLEEGSGQSFDGAEPLETIER